MNKTVIAMRLGVILSSSYIIRDLASLFASGALSVVGLFVSFFCAVFPFVFLYRMTVNYCCAYNDGKYQFSTPFAIAFRSYNFGGLIYTCFFYIYMKKINPDLMSDMVETYEKMLQGQGQEEMLAQLREIAAVSTPASLIPSVYFGFLLMGLIVSIIAVGAARFAKLKAIEPVNMDHGSEESN